MNWLFETSPSWAFVFLRLGLAIAFFAHSMQQIFGWFDGRGITSVLNNWKEKY
jgi:putative oxidoreductase